MSRRANRVLIVAAPALAAVALVIGRTDVFGASRDLVAGVVAGIGIGLGLLGLLRTRGA